MYYTEFDYILILFFCVADANGMNYFMAEHLTYIVA